MPATDTLYDDFPGAARDTGKWPGVCHAAHHSVSSGTLKITALSTGVSAWIESAASYNLQGSQFVVNVIPPPINTGTWAYGGCTFYADAGAGTFDDLAACYVSAGDQVFDAVLFTDGTQVGSSPAVPWSNIGYTGSVGIWLRISEAGGTITWAVSLDNRAWTTLRTAAAPVWISSTTGAIDLDADRSGGSDSSATFDYVNFKRLAPDVPVRPTVPVHRANTW